MLGIEAYVIVAQVRVCHLLSVERRMQHMKSLARYNATTNLLSAFHYVDGELKFLVVPHKAFGSDKRLLHFHASQCDLLEVAVALTGSKSSMDVIDLLGDDRDAL